MPLPKVKGRKLDPNFVSSQKWEIQYIATKFKVKPDVVRRLKKELGKSRRKIYAALRQK